MTDKPQAQEKLDTNQSRMAETVQGFSAADWRTAQTNRLDVQKLTDDHIEKINGVLEEKEKEIMEV